MLIKKSLETIEKLKILSKDSQYDLACACGINEDDRRTRSKDDKWIYPVVMPNGRYTFLFKTLLSNVCVNNCKYCPLRANRDPQRCSLSPEETAAAFTRYYRQRKVSGLFLTSGLLGTPDNTMQKINQTALILRRNNFRGYIHLKIMPGSSNAAIEKAISLASAVSLNIETAGEEHFKKLNTGTKDYTNDIIHPIKLISKLTAKGSPYAGVHHTTQFIVGASDETDQEIIKYSWGLYKRLKLNRIYFSAYQRGLGEQDLPGENSSYTNKEILTREHRLYQTDWLIRKYGFEENEIPFDSSGNLDINIDPKEAWAVRHPEFFPININKAPKEKLLRIPGLGHITVEQILKIRESGLKINSLSQLGRLNKRLEKASKYICF
ncbi:MAG: radical SAM protein [Candidatus Omnitrophota bacterium]